MHKPLPVSNGLLDGLSAALQMAEWEQQVSQAIGNLGFDAQAVGLPGHRTRLEGRYHRAPDKLAAPVIKAIGLRVRKGSRRPGIYTKSTCLCGRWWEYLGVLDDCGRVSPTLWVIRPVRWSSSPPKCPVPPDSAPNFRHFVTLLPYIAWQVHDPAVEPESPSVVVIDRAPFEDGVSCMGVELERNPVWVADTLSAHNAVRRPAKHRARSCTYRIVDSTRETTKLWRVQWHPREASVLDRRTDKRFTMAVPHPELVAIPFYRVDDLKCAFASIIESYLCIPLLDNVSDTQIAREGWVAAARSELGLPRRETRGRPPGRPLAKVRKVGRLATVERLSINKIAKLMNMARSTVKNYLKEYREKYGGTGYLISFFRHGD